MARRESGRGDEKRVPNNSLTNIDAKGNRFRPLAVAR
jgi:hypothetical protein